MLYTSLYFLVLHQQTFVIYVLFGKYKLIQYNEEIIEIISQKQTLSFYRTNSTQFKLLLPLTTVTFHGKSSNLTKFVTSIQKFHLHQFTPPSSTGSVSKVITNLS